MADEGWKKPIFIIKWMTKYFDSLMEKLDAIQNMFGTSGDADVSSADIRLGKKAYNGTTLVTGTMPENVAVAETLTAGEAYVIPQGYHDGTGKVTADSLASQTDGTATAAQILSGKTAYVDGVKVTGSMTNNGAKTASLAAGASYTIPAGYHDGTGKVTANSLASQTDGTATASQILSGKTAYVDGKKVTGSMGNKAGTTVEASAVTQDDTNTYFNVPIAGYYDTNSKVYTPNSNLGGDSICDYIESIKYTLPGTDGRGHLYVYINNSKLNIKSITFNSRPASYWRLKDVTDDTDTDIYYGYSGDNGTYPKTFNTSTVKQICIMYQAINTNNQFVLDDTTVTITR